MKAKVKTTGEIVEVFESIFNPGLYITFIDFRVFDYIDLEFI